ncbi:MAG: hypothetical protein WBW73_10545 [Rhodoplanes sp.]
MDRREAPSSLIRMTIRLCRRLLVLDRLRSGRLGPPAHAEHLAFLGPFRNAERLEAL